MKRFKFIIALAIFLLACLYVIAKDDITIINAPDIINLNLNSCDTNIISSKKLPKKAIYVPKPRNESSILKQAENRKLLAILTELNNLEIVSYDNTQEREKRKLMYKDIVSEISDPIQAARLIILSYYIAYPEDARTVAIDSHIPFDIYTMKHFIEQEYFIEAMSLIKSAIRLDAGCGYMFTDVLWNARHIAGVRERFPLELLRWENGLLQHGSDSEKANLKDEMQERVNIAVKLFLAEKQSREKVAEYFPTLFLSKNELKLFYFQALDKLLDNPQRPSLNYIWKRGLLVRYIKKLELKDIKDEDVLVLFKGLKVGSIMLTGDIDIVELLETKIGYNVSYDLEYLKSKNCNYEDRIDLIEKWQDSYLNKSKE